METLFKMPPGNPNPMVGYYGKGPAGARCGSCRMLLAHHYSRTYYKCELRGVTNGPATDHRVRWDACGRHQAVSQ